MGRENHDKGLLISQPDGRPIDPNNLCKSFRKWQTAHHIEDQIDFQGLRKSGQMHKVRITQNNYQLVAESSGQSPEVLMSNYNEALDSEKRNLSQLVEADLYSGQAIAAAPTSISSAVLLNRVKSDPVFAQQLLQLLLRDAETVV